MVKLSYDGLTLPWTYLYLSSLIKVNKIYIKIVVHLQDDCQSAGDWTDGPAVVEEEEAALPAGSGALDRAGAGGQHHGGPAQSSRENNYNVSLVKD